MAFFLKLKSNYLSKMHGSIPHIFFLDTNGTYKDLLSADIVLNHAKISLCLKASPIGKTEYLEMRRTYAQ